MDSIRFELTNNDTKYKVFGENSIEFSFEKIDVDLIIKHTRCDLGQAIRSLIKTNGDLVNSIMDLTI